MKTPLPGKSRVAASDGCLVGRIRVFPGVVASVLICACVGPDFHRPEPPQAERYTVEPMTATTAAAPGAGGAAQRFLDRQEVPRNWWTLFGSAELDVLVEEALRANPDVLSAQAALRQALENTAAQRGSYFPIVQGSVDATRNRDAIGVLQPTLNSGVPVYNLFTPQVSVSYVPDIFGANHRAVESLAAKAEANRFQLDATYLTLTANVVEAAIQEAGLRAQIAGTEQVIALARESLDVLRRELSLGAIAELDVYAQEAALAQLQGTLPPLTKQWHQARDQLALLTGHLPADFKPMHLELDQLILPTDLPLGVPSQLVERRPDVRAAEAQLHAATADLGVAMANLLPQVTLTGNIGSTATLLSDLFKPGTGFWGLGANVTQALFQGGTLIHRKRAADAALDQAGAAYKSAVLTAFQNVADALHALDADAEALEAATRAEDAAKKSLGVAHQQLEIGSVAYLTLVNSEQTYQQTVVALAQARANRYADTAALFQALGGSIAPIGERGAGR
jgi:NodT family efflux transporter outer membrane factor (OMF) lipoprotein